MVYGRRDSGNPGQILGHDSVVAPEGLSLSGLNWLPLKICGDVKDGESFSPAVCFSR